MVMLAEKQAIEAITPEAVPSPAVVIVGMGPVGIRTAQAILRRAPQMPLAIYGDEPWRPYNRVRLSSVLAGEIDWDAVSNELEPPSDADVVSYHNCPIASIERERRVVIDTAGSVQPYHALVLATGSRPHIPAVTGIDKAGVFTFRDMSDAQRLLARQARSRCTVVLGGGLLGLEAARAMQRQNTEVIVVEHAPRIMSRQLDTAAAELLRERILALGMRVVVGDHVTQVLGEDGVTGVRLGGGRELACDTLIVATGVRPNIDLARAAGLSVGTGVRVDDRMQTSDAHIFAVGECAEHRGQTYGVVAPGFEQAEVAAHCLLGGDSHYAGSTTATRLKVLGQAVFSMGRVGEEENPLEVKGMVFDRPELGIYRKLTVRRRRLVGAIAVGEWEQLGRIQEAVTQQRLVWPWQMQRFLKIGDLWSQPSAESVSQWPASTTVCNCTGVTRGQVTKAVARGAVTLPAITAQTGASSVCGSCRPLVQELLGESGSSEPERGYKSLLAIALLAGILAMAFAAIAPVPYAVSVDVAWQWDKLWRDGLAKQVTGFTALGGSLLLLLLSLRKRWRRFSFGAFAWWRVAHLGLGVLALVALTVHTGFRLGNNLNFYLMGLFVALSAIGVVVATVIGLEHRLDRAWARRLRSTSAWMHILLFWPLPVLLGFHVLKTYYF